MTQHRAFGNTRGAARILQKCDVREAEFNILQRLAGPLAQRIFETYGGRECIPRNRFLDVAQDKVSDQTARECEQIAHTGCDDVINRCFGKHFLECVRKVVEDDDASGPGVLELMLELARGVKRIYVDDDQSGAKDTAHCDRVLQNVRQHDGDAFAAHEAEILLQITRKLHRHFIELAVAQGLAHIGIGGAVGPVIERGFEQLTNGSIGGRGQLGIDAFRIGLQPDSVQVIAFILVARLR